MTLDPKISFDEINSKINELIENKCYDETIKLYNLVYLRFTLTKRFNELESLLIRGCLLLLEKEEFLNVIKLANFYIETFKQNPSLINDEKMKNDFIANIVKIYELLPQTLYYRNDFEKLLSGMNKEIFPIANINNLIGTLFWKENNYYLARRHFLRSAKANNPAVGKMLVHFQISSNADDEIDLLITQFVLQLLCLSRKIKRPLFNSIITNIKEVDLSLLFIRSDQHRFAITTLQTYILNHPKITKKNPPYQMPLLNFLAFLMLTIENGHKDAFGALVDCYKKELKRDRFFKRYLCVIGNQYFNVPLKRFWRNSFKKILRGTLSVPELETDNDDD